MSVNGIAFRIKTEDKDGNLTNVETVYFATFRKCPELAKYLKDSMKLETKAQVARRSYALAVEEVNKAAEEELEAVAAKIDKAKDDLQDAEDKMHKAFHGFIRKGLSAAGYGAEDVERFASYIDLRMFPEIVQMAKIGAGRQDFF